MPVSWTRRHYKAVRKLRAVEMKAPRPDLELVGRCDDALVYLTIRYNYKHPGWRLQIKR